MVYNATGLVVHDADAHIMETPNWLRDHADPSIRDRIQPLALPGRQRAAAVAGAPRAQRWISTPHSTGSRHATGRRVHRRSEAEEIMLRKNFAATGSFLPEDRGRALDLLGFASQLVFNTFHNTRLRDWEHAGDIDFAIGCARAHNRGMVEFCAADPRLLSTLYVPLADLERAPALAKRSDRDGRRRAADRVRLPAGALAEPRRARRRCGRSPRRPACRSSSTSAAPVSCSTRTTSATACPCRPTSTAARRTSDRSTTWRSRSSRRRRWRR